MEKTDRQFNGLIEDSLAHLHAALRLMDNPFAESFKTTIGFLLHLSTELILKALVYEKKGTFPKDHDLNRLLGCLDITVLSADLENFIKSVKDYHLLRYHHTDKGGELEISGLEELEWFWGFISLDSPRVREIILGQDWLKKYGVTFEPFIIGSTTVLDTKFVDGKYVVDAHKYFGEIDCPFCKENKCHSH